MKKLLLLKCIAFSFLAFVSVGKINAQVATDLFISEYVEGNASNRAIEIYNGTGADVDLSIYTIKETYNGEGWGIRGGAAMTEYVLPLTGILANGSAYVIYNDQANASIIAVGDLKLTYDTGTPGSRCAAYTGNDAVGLFKSDVLIDVIGVPSVSVVSWDVAGTAGATLDHTLVRKASVVAGSIDWTASAGTNATDSQWVVYDVDYVANLGTHTFGTVGLRKLPVSEVNIYPNPAKSFFNVKAPEGKYIVTINNSIGSVVKTSDVNSNGKIEVSDLNPGLYYVTVKNVKTNKNEMHKLIVK